LDVVSAFVNEEDISVDELKKLIRAAKNTKR
jgi:predicted transcriptional regulator